MNYFYKLIIVCLFMSGLSIRAQELVIGNAANLIVSQYAELVFGNGMNLVNNSTTGTFDGNITFKGPLPQSIGGEQPISLSKLKVQEGAILSLTNNVIVEQELNLTNGLIFLNDNNLRLSASATINGVFSETAMIVAEGEGALQRELSQNGTYLFPLEDTSDVDEYSPASFEFYSTDYSNGLLSVNLKNVKHPNNTSGSNYLNRYWSVEQTGLSNINCTVKFTYTNNDIVGSEGSMVGSYWNGSWWSPLEALSMNEIYGAVYGFGDFTGGELEALNIEKNEADDLQIIVDGNRVIINAESSFPIRKVEVYNKIGQFIQVFEPANALHYEFNLNNKTDIYLLRLTSDQKTISRKIAL
jgi:hypothetical protein